MENVQDEDENKGENLSSHDAMPLLRENGSEYENSQAKHVEEIDMASESLVSSHRCTPTSDIWESASRKVSYSNHNDQYTSNTQSIDRTAFVFIFNTLIRCSFVVLMIATALASFLQLHIQIHFNNQTKTLAENSALHQT